MNKSTWFVIFTAAILAGAWTHAPASSLVPSSAYPIGMTLPAASLDLSDLDLRDENNRKIQSEKAKRTMEQLFTKGLNDLLMFNLTPDKRRFLLLARSAWDWASGRLGRWFEGRLSDVEAWIQFKKNKFTRIVSVRRPLDFRIAGSVQAVDQNRENRFLYLIEAFLSSTFLLR